MYLLAVSFIILTNRPELYLLDEPFSALDKSTASKIMNTLLSQNESNSSFILTTNEIWHLKYADRVLYISEGEVEYFGEVSKFLNVFKGQKISKVRKILLIL